MSSGEKLKRYQQQLNNCCRITRVPLLSGPKTGIEKELAAESESVSFWRELEKAHERE